MKTKAAVFLIGATIIVGAAAHDIYKFTMEERAKRKIVLDSMGLEVAAIHRATDVVNARIERGDIRSYDQLRDAVLTEVAFQKIAIQEEL